MARQWQTYALNNLLLIQIKLKTHILLIHTQTTQKRDNIMLIKTNFKDFNHKVICTLKYFLAVTIKLRHRSIFFNHPSFYLISSENKL